MNTLKYLLAAPLALAALQASPQASVAPAAPRLPTIQTPEPAPLKVVRVAGEAEFRRALAQVAPGTRIEVAAGRYPGSYFFTSVRGEKGKPVVIAGADARNPPVFQGLHFSDGRFLTIQDITVENAPSNGLNIDDGGDYDGSSTGIVLRRVRVRDSRPPAIEGDYVNGIKLSGVWGFRLEECTMERWSNGSGVDMVGCRDGIIESCTFRHDADEEKTGCEALLIKGGSRDILVRRSFFENAGQRAINIGGRTDARFFRPPLKSWYRGEGFFESKHITVEGNLFVGGNAAISCTGTDSPTIRFNTIYKPFRWALRILQETADPGFLPSRGGVFERNLIVFDSKHWAEGGVNIGPNTEPKSFRFASNWWFCDDKPGQSRPSLPSLERGGTYGRDPLLINPALDDWGLKPGSPALGFGATAFGE